MEKLIVELMRLYLMAQDATRAGIEAHLRGQQAFAVEPENGMIRAIVLAFDQQDKGSDAHWTALCELASSLQVRFGFPAPAVSISGADGYRLWLSLAAPLPLAEAQQFIDGLHALGMAPGPANAADPVPLPPCLDADSGRWAAFINPGMGASFIDEHGLEVAPPFAAQATFLEGLDSIGLEQFRQALRELVPEPAKPEVAPPLAPQRENAAQADGLLLRDATLEDIVRYLHAKNIEPTFRHLIPGRP